MSRPEIIVFISWDRKLFAHQIQNGPFVHQEAEGAELAALNVEAELPLEDLLAMYKGARNNLDADFSSDAESEELQAHGLMNGKGKLLLQAHFLDFTCS